MKKNKEFYVSYIDGSLGSKTKQTLKLFVTVVIVFTSIAALVFSLTQKTFKNSTFELTNTTKIEGIFHKNPYPMLRVEVANDEYKSILLLGFGKSSANPFLEKLQKEVPNLDGLELSIEGNLIYYNGKTLLQITDDEKVLLKNKKNPISLTTKVISEMTFQGEIIDPKCYFGVMKPGKGKIHRSCAVRCISGGIPPVLATTDNNNISKYFLLTNLKGEPINQEILSFIGKPSEITGIVEKMEDWYIFKINTKNVKVLNQSSNIY